MSNTMIRRYSVQQSQLGGWYGVSGPLTRAAALAELKSARAESKRSRRGSTFRLHELPSVRHIRLANPCHCAPKRKSPCACRGHKVANPAKKATKKATLASLDTFTRAYIEAALWSSYDHYDEPLEASYDRDDIAAKTLATMVWDCAKFQKDNAKWIGSRSTRAGHDFWLTRNGLGVGFWDGHWTEPSASRLTDASERFGSFDLYVGDDGKIHH